MESSLKSRTPSRCREWERNRRNKFNDAISRLGDIVKEINRANNSSRDGETVQYSKIEIVEKATTCLTSCVQEKTQLKAELLALQVKLNSFEKKKSSKDASTQVFIGIRKKRQNEKYVKVLMLQKSKGRKALKEKSILTTNATVEAKVINNRRTKPSTYSTPTKLPILLPNSTKNDKKCPENTIVVLPAAPYIFPHRPLILPTVPPAFVLLDPNLQTFNKTSFPLVNRNNNDITKTTMVNILPISAYSRPLSATKTKKANAKTKLDISKKTKKSKEVVKLIEQTPNSVNPGPKIINKDFTDQAIKENEAVNENSTEKAQETKLPENTTVVVSEESRSQVNCNVTTIPTPNEDNENKLPLDPENNSNSTLKEKIQPKETDVENFKNVITSKCTISTTTENLVVQKRNNVAEISDNKSNASKIPTEKETVEKDKENKLPNILDTTLCENTADTGNARLELAEEFLAASPTAAFLMYFPLVSGNRADSPAEETPNVIPINPTKDNHSQRRVDITPQTLPFFEKPNPIEVKQKQIIKSHIPSSNAISKQNVQQNSNLSKPDISKIPKTLVTTNASHENPFLNLPMSSLLSTACTLSDTLSLEFDCNISKSLPSQPSSYVSNSNLFYKSDPFSSVKSTIYSTSNISSGHEFNSFGLYPCAMEKYAPKSKSDYPNVEDNLMKIGSSRLTYDIDLGWSHKSLDFVNCTTAPNTFSKDNILTSTSGTYSTSYNPFNPDFHVPLVPNANKKDNSLSKPSTSFSDTITSFYSQPTNLWSEDVPFYTNSNNATKTLAGRHQNYLPIDPAQANLKLNMAKQYEAKPTIETVAENIIKAPHTGVVQPMQTEKYTKKSPSKMHINWMTSEVRPMQPICDPTQTALKETHKPTYGPLDHITKKHEQNDNNYFPISMHNFPSQPVQEELLVWPSTRPAGTTEISIEPPPINLPTLVGDLALGPHDKKKSELPNRSGPQADIQNCSNFFSVSHLMNRSNENTVPSRYPGNNIDPQKSILAKHNVTHAAIDNNRKAVPRIESHVPQPCYGFNDSKSNTSYENMAQFAQSKVKASKSDKSSKVQKNSYSAESLLRGGTCNQKLQDNSAKFMTSSQKYSDFTPQDNSVAQVSHFPPIIDYSDNTYTGQQFSGTNLYNSTTNTISNSFYSNFMPGSSNLNYTGGPFSSEFIDYNQTTDCNYPNHKYTELKMRNNPTMFQQDKVPSNFKSSRRESAAKHKLECSKKDSNKKCQSKRAKLNNEAEEWGDASHLLWQNKTPSKRHSNLMSEELPFPNYVGNQMAGQYQPEFFNSHIMTSNMQSVGHNVERSLASLPVTSRANFNLSTIFPEITMKVQ